VNKVIKKRKIIDDDNINSEKEDKKQRKPKERTKMEKKWDTKRGKLLS
jgi:hypothetical protein